MNIYFKNRNITTAPFLIEKMKVEIRNFITIRT